MKFKQVDTGAQWIDNYVEKSERELKGKFYSQQPEGAYVYVGPAVKDLKKMANEIARPTLWTLPGIMWKVANFGASQDDIEYIELPMSNKNSAAVFYLGVQIAEKNRDDSYHYWIRQFKKDGKSSMMMIALPLATELPIDKKKIAKET